MITYLTCTAYSKNAPAGETLNIMTPDIHDITSPEEFLLGQPSLWQSPWFWVLVITGILIMGFVIHRLTKKKTNQKKRRQLLETAIEALAEVWSPDKVYVIYCDTQGCNLSWRITMMLREETGHDNIYYLNGLWREWLKK